MENNMKNYMQNYKTVILFGKKLRYKKIENGYYWFATPSESFIWTPFVEDRNVDKLEEAISSVRPITWKRNYGMSIKVKTFNDVFPSDMGGTWLGWNYIHNVDNETYKEIMKKYIVPDENMTDINKVLNNLISV